MMKKEENFYETYRVITRGYIFENDKRNEECRLLLQKIKDHSGAGGDIRTLPTAQKSNRYVESFSCTVLCNVIVGRKSRPKFQREGV